MILIFYIVLHTYFCDLWQAKTLRKLDISFAEVTRQHFSVRAAKYCSGGDFLMILEHIICVCIIA